MSTSVCVSFFLFCFNSFFFYLYRIAQEINETKIDRIVFCVYYPNNKDSYIIKKEYIQNIRLIFGEIKKHNMVNNNNNTLNDIQTVQQVKL